MVDRRAKRWVFTAVAVLGALALMVLPNLIAGPAAAAGAEGGHILRVTAAALLATVCGLGFTILAFRQEDEFVQQGSKYAWYWGAAGGVVASAPIYVFVRAGGLHWLDPAIPFSRELGKAFALGYGLLLVAQLLGFLAVLAFWKATRR